ncbi:uncharacterized protein LOC135094298 [Scylla paramamosain]|uniref:uncharacterized protein LOC135094298 n=1 Tax=Scylla paramamosain TaxID=85552 RepID=UPI003083044E
MAREQAVLHKFMEKKLSGGYQDTWGDTRRAVRPGDICDPLHRRRSKTDGLTCNPRGTLHTGPAGGAALLPQRCRHKCRDKTEKQEDHHHHHHHHHHQDSGRKALMGVAFSTSLTTRWTAEAVFSCWGSTGWFIASFVYALILAVANKLFSAHFFHELLPEI